MSAWVYGLSDLWADCHR